MLQINKDKNNEIKSIDAISNGIGRTVLNNEQVLAIKLIIQDTLSKKLYQK